MQKKLTVLFAFAIFVLIIGWAITPAQAHCRSAQHNAKPGPEHDTCGNGDSGNGGPQTGDVTLAGGMVTERRFFIPVIVQTDNSKKIVLGHQDPVDDVTITTNFGNSLVCTTVSGDDPPDPRLLAELDGQRITSDFIHADVDHRKRTGFYNIEYISVQIPSLGPMRIQFRNPDMAEVSDCEREENCRIIHYKGPVRVWQRNEASVADNNIAECRGNTPANNPTLDVILREATE